MDDTILNFNLPTNAEEKIIKAIGVGGGGGNAVSNMYMEGISDVSFALCNTDNQALRKSSVPNKLLIGTNTTGGLGAGDNPAKGEAAALESEAHERAWLLRVAANRCKSLLRLKWRRREDIDELPLAAAEPPDTGAVRQAVEHLPPHYKAPVYLYYYEDYSGEEIAQLLRLPASTVRSRLRRARLLLQKQLGDDFLEE